MNRCMKLVIMSSLVFGVACGDDDGLPTFDAGTVDGSLPDVPTLDVVMIDGGDPCTGIAAADRCGTEGTTCAGDTLTTCAANANGCLVTTGMDCSTDGSTCDDSGAVAMCSSDPCMGITNCDGDERSCDGDTLSVCALDAVGCSVLTETDCAADETTCDDTGAMAVCVDECDGISDCDTESRSCDMDNLVVCAPDAAGCLVETTTDCAGAEASCDDSVDPIACVDIPCPAAVTSGLVLDCGTGTITATTEGGTTSINDYCGAPGTRYDAPEVVYGFGDARASIVTITAVREAASSLDMDLFVLDGGDGSLACGQDSACVAGSVGGSDTETVTFAYLPGTTNYVAYDAYIASGGTTGFELTVECAFTTCGDSMIEGAEVCDDGNADASDGCSDLCQVESGYTCTEDGDGLSTCVLTCGDGVVDGADVCDDNNRTDGDGCDSGCGIEDGYLCTEDGDGLSTCVLSCGDSVINGEDECDDGNMMATDGCSDTCVIEPGYLCTEDGDGLSTCEFSCGDGVVNGDDECDDMNGTDADGCTACVVDMGYTCSGAPSVCVVTCGDGEFDADLGEACDDGNTDNGDGCAMDCTLEADFVCANEDGETSICGPELARIDGVLEDADTAWSRPNADCTPRSGTTVFEAVEYTNSTGAEQTVDIFTDYAYDGYMYVFSDVVDAANPTTNCVAGNDDFTNLNNSLLQDIVVPAGETIQIVISAWGSGRGEFSVYVTDAAFGCGNGLTDVPGDACDDGNTADGDGCSAACALEVGFECDDAEPTACIASVCGNGVIESGEECDDMDADAGDGCSGTCTVEDTYICDGEPSICVISLCGNAVIDDGEVCEGTPGCADDCRSAVFTGDLEDTDALWNRPEEDCSYDDSVGNYYDVVPFTWAGLVDETLTFTVAWDGVDGFAHTFSDPFDAAAAPTGCIDGGDDLPGFDTSGSIAEATMTPGLTVNAIMTTWGNGTTGGWTLTVTR